MAYGLSIGTTFGPVRWRVLYEVRKWTSPAAMNAARNAVYWRCVTLLQPIL